MGEWIVTEDRGYGLDNVHIESLDGVLWADAPLPKPWHACKPQTRGWIGLNSIERCACGATRHNRGGWTGKNETRKARKRDAREARLPRVQVTCDTCGNTYEAAEGTHQARDRLCNSCWSLVTLGS